MIVCWYLNDDDYGAGKEYREAYCLPHHATIAFPQVGEEGAVHRHGEPQHAARDTGISCTHTPSPFALYLSNTIYITMKSRTTPLESKFITSRMFFNRHRGKYGMVFSKIISFLSLYIIYPPPTYPRGLIIPNAHGPVACRGNQTMD